MNSWRIAPNPKNIPIPLTQLWLFCGDTLLPMVSNSGTKPLRCNAIIFRWRWYIYDVLYVLYVLLLLYVLYVHTGGEKIFCMTLMMKGVAEGRSGALREVMRLFSLIFSLSAKCTAMNRQRNLRRKNWIWPISITNTDNLLISIAITMTMTMAKTVS